MNPLKSQAQPSASADAQSLSRLLEVHLIVGAYVLRFEEENDLGLQERKSPLLTPEFSQRHAHAVVSSEKPVAILRIVE